MPYTGMKNLAAGDLVTEADMDALRQNLDYLHLPNAVYTGRGGISTTSTNYVDIAGLSAVHTAYGGMTNAFLSVSVVTALMPGIYIAIDIDGTTVAVAGYLTIDIGRGMAVTLVHATALASGVHTIKAQWKASAAGVTAGISTGQLLVFGG